MSEKTKGKADASQINVLYELDNLGLKYEPVGDEVKIKCPFHDDSNPSCFVNTKNKLFRCQTAGCDAKGDFFTLFAKLVSTDRAAAISYLAERYDVGVQKHLNPERVEEWHERIWNAGPLLEALRERGCKDDDLRIARIGFDRNRITIPVANDEGYYINVRKYLPGAPSKDKMRNMTGYEGTALYQGRPGQLKYDDIWLCGGEIKALVASRLLNPMHYGAVAVTGAEGAWDPSFDKKFKDKRVYVCFDIDAGGRAAARKIARRLTLTASSVKIINLPLDSSKYPKGDLNDFVGKEDGTGEDLIRLAIEAEQVFFQEEDTPENMSDQDVVEVKLAESTAADLYGKRLSIDAVVNAMDTTPYIVPKEIGVICNKDQPNCDICPVRPKEPDPVSGEVKLTIRGTSPGVLQMVNAPKKMQKQAIREAARIPSCKACEFKVKSHLNVHDVRLTPPLEVTGENKDHVVQPAYVVDADLELNAPYVMSGRVFPHPKNQQAILLIDDTQKATDNLSSYNPENEDLERLRVFQADGDIQAKLDEIYQDLECNITRIYHRRNLHLAVDLAFHSVLGVPFDGYIQNGWINLLIAGDSSQGKSETTQMLMKHYQVGAKYECKNASGAGLIGGATKMSGGERWFIQWGVIPTHDKRLVVMEEIKGTPVEVLGKLTDMRSSGIAEVTMIERRKALARTRLIMISNPRSERPVASYNFGVEVIKELIGSLEDIRRFDLATVMSSKEIDPGEINRINSDRPLCEHKYTTKLCRELVLWAWSRTPNQIRFAEGAEQECLKQSIQLCSKFTETVPLVDRGTMRYKIARMATALAARLFSTDGEELSTLLVKKEHVEFIGSFVDRMYSSDVLGYEDFSRAQVFANKVIDPTVVTKAIKNTKYPKDFVEHMLHADEITLTDLCDWCEMERSDGQQLLSFLVRKHAIYRVKRWYVKTGEFISLLKSIKDNVPERGEHTKGDTF